MRSCAWDLRVPGIRTTDGEVVLRPGADLSAESNANAGRIRRLIQPIPCGPRLSSFRSSGMRNQPIALSAKGSTFTESPDYEDVNWAYSPIQLGDSERECLLSERRSLANSISMR